MKSIDDTVIESVLNTLAQGRLFRYDCSEPEESPTALLEKRLAELIGVRYCVAMNSCSSALFTALLACGIKPGDKVLIPAFTFIAVPSAIVHAGAQPVLVEVTADYTIDLDDLESKIDRETKVLLLSYMRGRVPDLDRVMEICQRRGVTLIEDAAHSLGVLWGGRPTGTFGRAAAFSAQSYKMIDGGEGGLLVTDDREIAFKAMLYAGCYEKNWSKHFGVAGDGAIIDAMINHYPAYNFRMSNLSAAALLPQLDQLEERVARYICNYNLLVPILNQSPHLQLPQFHPKVRPAPDSIQFLVKDLPWQAMAEFQEMLNQAGLKLSIFGLDKRNARCFWRWSFFSTQSCPRTEQLVRHTADLRLPLHLNPVDVERIGTLIVDTLDRVACTDQDVALPAQNLPKWTTERTSAA